MRSRPRNCGFSQSTTGRSGSDTAELAGKPCFLQAWIRAAYVKAAFLADLANGKAKSPLVSPEHAVKLLGTMLGGYNVPVLVALLDGSLADQAVAALSHTILMFDAFHDVEEKPKQAIWRPGS